MPLFHCPIKFRWHHHYSNILSGVIQVACYLPSPFVPLLLSLWAILSTGQILMTLSTGQRVYNHPKHLSQRMCVCAKVSNSQHSGTISKTPRGLWHKLKLHPITSILEETGLLHTSYLHSECETLSSKLLQTSLNNPNSSTRSMWVNADQDTVSSCLQNIWARSHLSTANNASK